MIQRSTHIAAKRSFGHKARQKLIFVDRDGTINYENPEERALDTVVLIPGATEAIKLLKDHNFYVVVVSNQPRIAWGVLTESEYIQINSLLIEVIENAVGVSFDHHLYCPHDDDSCPWRKPNPGMLLHVANRTGCNLTQSWIIGDSHRDVLAGQAVGAKTILVDTPNTISRDPRLPCQPDFTAPNLLEAVKLLLASEGVS